MSRKIDRRLIVTGSLECIAPLHVGGLESQSAADLALSVNGAGQYYIPGTSLAGSFRHACLEMFGEDQVDRLWGFQEQDGTEGHASFIVVEDAVLPVDAAAVPEIRDGVGIDRYSGAAAQGIKFNREVLPAGTMLDLRLVVDLPPRDEAGAMAMLAALLHALQEGEIRLGAGKSRGLGKVKLTGLKVVDQRLASKAGILSVLSGATAGESDPTKIWPQWKALRRARPLIGIEIAWRPIGPLMVKASADGLAVDTLPLIAAHADRRLRLVLPGSSCKGVLRTQAERILTTLLGKPVAHTMRFLAQLDRHPLAETLLGARNDPAIDSGKRDSEPGDGPALPGLSALAVEDCHSDAAFDPETVQYLLGAAEGAAVSDPGAFVDALPQYKDKTVTGPWLDPAMHVAIDRWTGSAADSALFSVLEPRGFTWKPLQLAIDVRRLARHPGDACGSEETVALAAFALLLLTLRDVAAGDVPLGFATNRGFGAIEVESVTVTVPKAAPHHSARVAAVLEALEGLSGAIAVRDGRLMLPRAGLEKVEEAWRAYLAAHRAYGVATPATAGAAP